MSDPRGMATGAASGTASPRTARRRRRVPGLGPLLIVALLISAFVPAAGPVRPAAFVPAYKPWCLVDDPDVPDEAYAVEQFARTHNFSPPPGLKGNSPFEDAEHGLPALLRPYKEYDVFPSLPGAGRRSERVILSDRIPYASWYTPNHYDNFILMFPLGCLQDPSRLLP